MRLHAFAFLGNHYHLLLTAESAQQLAAFMGYLNSNLAREIGREVGWREKFWGRRYQAILVSSEEPAQVERLRYILSHGCKENLVRSPKDWPGATAVRSLLTGASIRGTWIDRSALYEARRAGRRDGDRERFETQERLELAPLPCWEHLDQALHRRRVAELVERIEDEAGERALRIGRKPLGARRIRLQSPFRATKMKDRPAPLVHAASKAARGAVREAYREFVDSFRRAARTLREEGFSHALSAQFPPGCFPPASPFVALAGGARS